MTIEVADVVSSVILSVAGTGVLGNYLLERFKGGLETRLRRLDAVLQHGNFMLQRFAEFELEAITECWRAARACLPLLNATRPEDSGTNEDALQANVARLSDAHNALLTTVGRHEPFLATPMADTLHSIALVVRRELSQINHRPHFVGDWWDQGARNQKELDDLINLLLGMVKVSVVAIRAGIEAAADNN